MRAWNICLIDQKKVDKIFQFFKSPLAKILDPPLTHIQSCHLKINSFQALPALQSIVHADFLRLREVQLGTPFYINQSECRDENLFWCLDGQNCISTTDYCDGTHYKKGFFQRTICFDERGKMRKAKSGKIFCSVSSKPEFWFNITFSYPFIKLATDSFLQIALEISVMILSVHISCRYLVKVN